MRKATKNWVTCDAKCHGYLATDYSWHISRFNYTPRKKVYAVENGVIASTGTLGICGKAVNFDGQKARTYRYCHLSEIRVRRGQKVKEGDVIGIMGHTGLPKANGVHLHLIMWVNNKRVPPDQTINKIIKAEAMKRPTKQEIRTSFFVVRAKATEKQVGYYRLRDVAVLRKQLRAVHDKKIKAVSSALWNKIKAIFGKE